MIKPELIQYMKNAIHAFESGEHSVPSQIKILRVVSEFAGKEAERLEQKIVDQVDSILYNTHIDNSKGA